MDTCPHCGAPGTFDRAGRCDVCGMAVSPEAESTDHHATSHREDAPVESAVPDPAMAEREVATLMPEQVGPGEAATIQLPEDPGGDEADDTVAGEELIRPRELSPAYARRVTAVWEQTQSQFHDPQETIKSESSSNAEVGPLNIGARAVGPVEDAGEKDYELTEVIGEGAMGVVWSARQSSLNRSVAIKVPKGAAARTENGRQQFMSEVVVTGQLDHPNIVPIYELGRDAAGELFYSMKRVEGRAWNELLEERVYEQHENLEILMKVCDAIRFAHDRGVIHRDIKPHNVMVGQYGEVSVMDWGIALRLQRDAPDGGVTRISPAGTPAYMAPEMATGAAGDIGPWTDVYLLGAVLYEIITGEPPHPPPTDSEIQLQVLNDALLIAARNEITPITQGGELNKIAYRAMATEVQNRYQSVDELQEAIRGYLSHVESINLTERGTALLDRARTTGRTAAGDERDRFDDFDRARFAFEEALTIWPGNRTARIRHGETLLAYARYAYEVGAYARGIALLNEDQAEHRDLLRKLKAARRRTNRLSMLLRAAILLIIVGGGAFSFFLYQAKAEADRQRFAAVEAQGVAEQQEAEARRQRDEAERQKSIAEEEKAEAERQRTEADNQRMLAEQRRQEADAQRLEAERQKGIADDQRKEADIQRDMAVRSEAAAQAASYAFEIGLAAEELQRNAFDHAQDILASQEASEAKRSLRNWEWGHLKALVDLDARNFNDRGQLLQSRVESTAVSGDGKWIAAGVSGGDIYVWQTDRGEQPVRVRYGAAVHAVAITPDGGTLLAAGRTADGRHPIYAWNLPVRPDAEPDRKLGYDRAPNLSLDISSDGQQVLSGAADGWVGLASLAGSAPPVGFVATSHSNSIHSVRFSPDDRWFVTAGEDGVVRVWNAEATRASEGAVREFQRFEGHDGPVYAAAFSPDGQTIVTGGRDRRLLAIPFDDAQAEQAGYSPADDIRERLASDAAEINAEEVVVLGEHDGAVRSVAFATDAPILFSAGQDHAVRVWDTSGGFGQARLLKTLRGHGGWVSDCVAMPGDSSSVLSGGYDRRVRLWNWEQYHFPLVLRDADQRSLGDQQLTAGAAANDGQWVAAGSRNGVVTVWDMSDPLNPVSQTLAEGHDWQATTAEYFPDGQRLLTAGGDNTALVWDAGKGNELVRMGGWNTSVGAGWRGVASVSADGKQIATGAQGEVLARIWDAETGEPIAEIPIPNAQSWAEADRPEATSMDYSPDGRLLVIGDQWGSCYLIDVDQQYRLRTYQAHQQKIAAVKFMPAGDSYVTASSDGTAVRWDRQAEAPRALATYQHDDRVVALDIRDDGSTIVTATGAEATPTVLRVWNPADPAKPVRTLAMEALGGDPAGPAAMQPRIRAIALHPNQEEVLVTIYDPQTSTYRLGSWRYPEDQFQAVSNRKYRDVSTAIYAPQPTNAILTVGGRGARLQETGQNAQVRMTYRPQSQILSINFSPDGNTLVSASQDGSLKIWSLDDEQKWQPEAKLAAGHQGAIRSVAFHPTNDERFVTAGADGKVQLWQRADGVWESMATLGVPGETPLESAVFVANGPAATPVVAGGAAGTYYWSSPDAEPVVLDDREAITAVAASADGRWLASAAGSEVRLYDVQTRQRVGTPLMGHAAAITDVAFTPDSSRLFTTSRDSTVKLWDSSAIIAGGNDGETQRELLTLEGHSDEVTSITVAPGDEHPVVLTTGLDGQAVLWPAK